MRNVRRITEDQLQLVTADRQRHLGFGLSRAEVKMFEVVRDRLVEAGHLGVDNQMVMPGVGPRKAGWRNTHVLQTEIDGDLLRDRVAVLQADEIDLGIRWRGSARDGLSHVDGDLLRQKRWIVR